jgi:cation transport protein ChaC
MTESEDQEPPFVLNRDTIKQGLLQQFARDNAHHLPMRIRTDEEREASIQRMLAETADGQDVWVFGYGSLMWNPAFHFVEERPALLRGYHRRFCFWTPLGRGTPENPGLMLGLITGGSCRGLAFRIAPEVVEQELSIVWAREMMGDVYRPDWFKLQTDQGPIRAIAFTLDRGHERFVGDLPIETVTRHVATAAGRLGPCMDYLVSTVKKLEETGVRRGPMHNLLERTRAHRAAAGVDGGVDAEEASHGK